MGNSESTVVSQRLFANLNLRVAVRGVALMDCLKVEGVILYFHEFRL